MKTTILIFAIYGFLIFTYQIIYTIRNQKRINKLRNELINNADSLMD